MSSGRRMGNCTGEHWLQSDCGSGSYNLYPGSRRPDLAAALQQRSETSDVRHISLTSATPADIQDSEIQALYTSRLMGEFHRI